jgi:hypothetical protein
MRALPPNPFVRVNAVLHIDRAAYFKLDEVTRQGIVSTVTGAGGYIRLTRDLATGALHNRNIIASDLKVQNP